MKTPSLLNAVILPPSVAPATSPSHALILLHGYGANAQDLLPLRDEIAPSWTAIAIEAPIDLGPMGMPGGRAWFHISPDPNGGLTYDQPGAEEVAMQLACTIPEVLAQQNVESKHVAVLGFSQGAMLGHGLLLKHAMPMAGLAACSGRMVPELFQSGTPLAEGQPLFLSHGTFDDIIPVTDGHAIRHFYSTETDAEITWCEEAIGHGIGPQMLTELKAWMAGLDQTSTR